MQRAVLRASTTSGASARSRGRARPRCRRARAGTASPGGVPRTIATRMTPAKSCIVERSPSTATARVVQAARRLRGHRACAAARGSGRARRRPARARGPGIVVRAGGGVHAQDDEPEEARPAGALHGDVLDARERHDRPRHAPDAAQEVELLLVQLPAPARVVRAREDEDPGDAAGDGGQRQPRHERIERRRQPERDADDDERADRRVPAPHRADPVGQRVRRRGPRVGAVVIARAQSTRCWDGEAPSASVSIPTICAIRSRARALVGAGHVLDDQRRMVAVDRLLALLDDHAVDRLELGARLRR